MISSNFECGSIDVVDVSRQDAIQLKLKPDSNSSLRQWFYFRVDCVSGKPLGINILNINETEYPDGWGKYQVLASYDRQKWVRVPTTFDGKVLHIQLTPTHNSIFFAYCTPYTFERHLDFLAKAQLSDRCTVSMLGRSVQGRSIDMLTIGTPGPGKRKCWYVGRQHSGETMAEWFLEGVAERLITGEDEVTKALLDKAVFYVVPNINPDGTVLGHQRLNALGVDLNREWLEPSVEKSPEVFCIRQKMQEVGVDFFMDAHGDENLPYVFLAARQLSERIETLRDQYKAGFLKSTPEFQTKVGYVADPAMPINTRVAVNYVGTTFDCVSFTLEMPFSDNDLIPDADHGWSADRSKALGVDSLPPLLGIMDSLR